MIRPPHTAMSLFSAFLVPLLGAQLAGCCYHGDPFGFPRGVPGSFILSSSGVLDFRLWIVLLVWEFRASTSSGLSGDFEPNLCRPVVRDIPPGEVGVPGLLLSERYAPIGRSVFAPPPPATDLDGCSAPPGAPAAEKTTGPRSG